MNEIHILITLEKSFLHTRTFGEYSSMFHVLTKTMNSEACLACLWCIKQCLLLKLLNINYLKLYSS